MNIHPDVLGDINTIVRKLLKDEEKKVVESYLKVK